MTALDDAVTGVNVDCVHTACAGWASCQYVPEPFGPELPALVVDAEGKCWGRHSDPMTSKVWWYGVEMVTWSQLCRIRDGRPRRPDAGSLDRTAFPWASWIGADYDASVEEAKALQARRRAESVDGGDESGQHGVL